VRWTSILNAPVSGGYEVELEISPTTSGLALTSVRTSPGGYPTAGILGSVAPVIRNPCCNRTSAAELPTAYIHLQGLLARSGIGGCVLPHRRIVPDNVRDLRLRWSSKIHARSLRELRSDCDTWPAELLGTFLRFGQLHTNIMRV